MDRGNNDREEVEVSVPLLLEIFLSFFPFLFHQGDMIKTVMCFPIDISDTHKIKAKNKNIIAIV